MVVDHNRFLTKLMLRGLPKGMAGSVRFEVVFELEKSGSLSVSVHCEANGARSEVEFDYRSMRLRDDESEKRLGEAEQHKVADTREFTRRRKRAALLEEIEKTKYRVEKVRMFHVWLL